MTWLEVAKNLPVGQNARIDCPQCGQGTNTNAAIVNHNPKYYSCYCNACGPVAHESKGVLSLEERAHIQDLNNEAFRLAIQSTVELPKDTTFEPEDFSREARMWLYKSGLTPTVWRKYRIGYSARLKRVVLPVYGASGNLIWYQCRAILAGQKPKYIQPSADRTHVYFTAGNEGHCDRAIVVEDIMSAIRVGEATLECTKPTRSVSLLGTKITSSQADYLSEHARVSTWLDGDKAGKAGARLVRQVVGMLTEVDNIRTVEDPKCYSNKEILEYLNV